MAQRSDFRQTHPGSPLEEHPRSGSGNSGNHSRGETYRERGHAAGELAEGQECATHAVGRMVDRYPYASLLTGVGVGFGFGMALTLLLPRRQPSWYEQYVPESMHHLPERLRKVPETLGSYLPAWKRS
jgi:hypothetical protein